MRQFLNRRVKLTININGRKLYYTALVTAVTDEHITFIDKYGAEFCFMIKLIEEAQLIS